MCAEPLMQKALKPLAYFIENRKERQTLDYLKDAEKAFSVLSDKAAIPQLAEIPLEAASKALPRRDTAKTNMVINMASIARAAKNVS